MRTTLKRGLGRGAAPNGNGKAVFPPGTSSPVTLYRQPEPSRRSRAGLIGRVAMWLGIACLVVATGTAGGAYLYFHESVAAVAAKTPEVRKAARQLDVALPGQPAVALVIGYDARKGGRADGRSLGHADARPRGSVHRLDLAPLVPARHERGDPLPGTHAVLRQDQRRVRDLRPAGLAPDRARAHRRPDQLPDHGQLPRLPADRRPARRRVDRRRPALLQRPWRPVRLRDDQPPSGLPAAHRAADARLRALPPHGLRPLPRGAPAAVRQGVQGPDPGELRARSRCRRSSTRSRTTSRSRRVAASTSTGARCSRTRSSRTGSRAGGSSRRGSRVSRASRISRPTPRTSRARSRRSRTRTSSRPRRRLPSRSARRRRRERRRRARRRSPS